MSTSFSSSAAEAATAFEVNGDWLLADPGVVPAQAGVRVSAVDGRFNAITPVALPAGRARRLLLPALANAHDHARHFRSSTLGATGQPLETWLPFLGTVSALDPYLCAATSFARSVRKGVTHLMVHYTTVQGGMPYVDEARAVARAARDVGVRIGFAVAMRDRNGIAYTLDGDDAPVLAALRPGIRDAVAGRLKVRPVAPAAQLALVDTPGQRMLQQRRRGERRQQLGFHQRLHQFLRCGDVAHAPAGRQNFGETTHIDGALQAVEHTQPRGVFGREVAIGVVFGDVEVMRIGQGQHTVRAARRDAVAGGVVQHTHADKQLRLVRLAITLHHRQIRPLGATGHRQNARA